MTAAYEDARDDLADALGGPEPDWTEPPSAPPDADRANAMGYRLRKLVEERAGIVANAQAEIDRAAAWRDRRCARIDVQTEWIVESLKRYHAALFTRDRQATHHLPNVTLKSTKRRDTVEFDDVEFLTWATPPDLNAKIGEVYEATQELVDRLVADESPMPEGVRVKVTVTTTIAKDAAKKAILASGEIPPGAVPFKATATDRTYTVEPASFDEQAPPIEEAI